METRAPYALIGLFVLAAIGAVFGFVYWLNNTGGLSKRTVYHIRFENTVSGLLKGAAVLFNGIRVGEVTDLQLNPDNPRQVMATIAVATSTPVRADTHVGLDFQGLTGVPVIALEGGSNAPSAWPTSPGEPPVLNADPMAGQSMNSSRPRRTSSDRSGPSREFGAAAQHDRQSQHVLGGARAQFRSPRRDRRWGGADGRQRPCKRAAHPL